MFFGGANFLTLETQENPLSLIQTIFFEKKKCQCRQIFEEFFFRNCHILNYIEIWQFPATSPQYSRILNFFYCPL
jgi:hypothetical protein